MSVEIYLVVLAGVLVWRVTDHLRRRSEGAPQVKAADLSGFSASTEDPVSGRES